MTQPSFYPANSLVNRLVTLALLAMGLIYIAGAFTPLHIHFDSVRYFNIKDCIQYGCDPNSEVAKDYLPYGYTGLLIALSKIGVLNSFTIVFVNCLFLFTALYFVSKIFAKLVHPVLFAIIALFNWTVIKFAMHPLSEMQYLFFSCTSLYCFHIYIKKKSYRHLALAFFFAFATMLTRTVGISLIPALVLGILWQHRMELKKIIQKNKLILIGIALAGVALIFFARQLKIVDYTSLLKGPLEKGLGNFFAENFKNHFTELAEVFINMPANKVEGYVPGGMGKILFIALGVVCLAWILISLFSSKSKIPFYIRAYLFFYIFIIFNWPYYDPRFWVPVLPLLVILILRTPFTLNGVVKGISRLYLGIYLLLGFAAAAYALYNGFNKDRFARTQAAGDYRNEYEIHFFGKPQSDTATKIDQNVIDILKKYD
jgi:hypothetical protein